MNVCNRPRRRATHCDRIADSPSPSAVVSPRAPGPFAWLGFPVAVTSATGTRGESKQQNKSVGTADGS